MAENERRSKKSDASARDINQRENSFIRIEENKILPKIPLLGDIDLTYRCNNYCRHCWLWEAANSPLEKDELTFEEIRNIVDAARALGCQDWAISGGEPMIRPDFLDIYSYLSRHSRRYCSVNTNGTLITPYIARNISEKDVIMVALYGADANVYDHITRNPGGFEQAMRGMHYLKEAGVKFLVQLIPMKDNWHQWNDMQALAENFGSETRIGVPWLWKSCDHSFRRNAEIEAQRLPARTIVDINPPNISYDERMKELAPACYDWSNLNVYGNRLFATCIEARRDFHIDAYGSMSWCGIIKDPKLRYDLRKGTFKEAWEIFIPSCADKVVGSLLWEENCGSCDLFVECDWCPAYAYLETGDYSSPVPYFCEIAREKKKYASEFDLKHRRYFEIAGVTICVQTVYDIKKAQFPDKFSPFVVDGPGEDNVVLNHYFEIPELNGKSLGKELHHRVPWVISQKGKKLIYRHYIAPSEEALYSGEDEPAIIGVFNQEHTHGVIYSRIPENQKGLEYRFQALSRFPSDHIWLSQVLADREAVVIHASALTMKGKGLMFAAHSGGGKSTTVELIKASGRPIEILCDDRNIVRRWPEGWRVHGTWSHGTVSEVSSASAPLAGIFLLHKSDQNRIERIYDRKKAWLELWPMLVRGLAIESWWHKALDIFDNIIDDIPCYRLYFDKSGRFVDLLESFLDNVG